MRPNLQRLKILSSVKCDKIGACDNNSHEIKASGDYAWPTTVICDNVLILFMSNLAE